MPGLCYTIIVKRKGDKTMKNLIEVLNRIANEYDCEVVIGNEFAYYYSESKIVVNPADTDERFFELARANGLNEKVSNFVISFFHELGHNETMDFIEEEYEGDKNALSMEEYFYLEEEYEATMWAIDFCNNNMDIVEEIEKNL
jgi:hypothetical protein